MTPDDDPLPPTRGSGTYLRTLVGRGIDVTLALEIHGEDLTAFLDQNRNAMRVAIARGGGWFVTDLGHVLELDAPGTRRLAALLREDRAELDAILAESGPFTADRVKRLADALSRVASRASNQTESY